MCGLQNRKPNLICFIFTNYAYLISLINLIYLFLITNQVCEDYRKEGGITQTEKEAIDRFIMEIGEKWKGTSTELRQKDI